MADEVARLGASDQPEVLDVLLDAFRNYPVMKFVLGDAPEFERRMRVLTNFFLSARVLRGEPIFGARGDGELIGVALVSDPQGPPSPPELARMREEVWAELGTDERARYDAFSATCQPLLSGRPRLHLNMIGVRRSSQGQGIGRLLLEQVHHLASEHPLAEGVSLTTEDERNVRYYRAAGYGLTGEGAVGERLRTWAFFRKVES